MTYRLSFEVDDEVREYFDQHLEWGEIRRCFAPIVDDFIRMHKEHGDFFLAAVKSRDISLKDWYKGIKE